MLCSKKEFQALLSRIVGYGLTIRFHDKSSCAAKFSPQRHQVGCDTTFIPQPRTATCTGRQIIFTPEIIPRTPRLPALFNFPKLSLSLFRNLFFFFSCKHSFLRRSFSLYRLSGLLLSAVRGFFPPFHCAYDRHSFTRCTGDEVISFFFPLSRAFLPTLLGFVFLWLSRRFRCLGFGGLDWLLVLLEKLSVLRCLL